MRCATSTAARRPRRTARTWPALTCFVVVCCGLQASAQAQNESSEADDRERLSRLVTARTGDILIAAQDSISAGDYAGARERLSQLRLEQLSPYERGRAEYYFFAIAFAEERYEAARAHLDAMIGSGGLNEQEIELARFERARLYLAEEDWARGAAALEQWISTAASPNAQAYYLLAAAFYQLENYSGALAPARTAVELTGMADAAAAQLLLAIYAARAEYAQGIPLLERLIVLQPDDKRWWLQLSSYYGLVEDHANALAVLDLANHLGYVTTEADLVRLAELAAFNGIPYRCATLMTSGLERAQIAPSEGTYRRAGNCWLAARELDRSIAPLTAAASMSRSGDGFLRIAEVQVQLRDWRGVVSAADRGLEKGRLDDAGRVHLLKGVALMNLDRTSEARASLVNAARFPRHARTANQYINAIDLEN